MARALRADTFPVRLGVRHIIAPPFFALEHEAGTALLDFMSDLRWARTYFVPWIQRRLQGRSSGDDVTAKRPDLLPL